MRKDIYIRPRKAEKVMQQAHAARQTVWLYAMAGAGKTAFVRDYIGRKPYMYFSGGECLKKELDIPEDGKEHIVVIDDMHAVTDGDERAQMYSLLESLMRRKDIWLILIARCRIPKWLTPLYVEHMFCVITAQELMLTYEQQSAYMEMMDINLTGRTSRAIWDMAQGHPLFYYLFALELTAAEATEGGRLGNSDRRKLELSVLPETVKRSYDYAETRVYARLDKELQKFLMEMSIVKRFDLHMAQIVTERENAGRLLNMAEEAGDFLLERDGFYEYQPRARHSLRQRLERFYTAEEVRRLIDRAGRYYERKGDIPAAVSLYAGGHNQDEILRLLTLNTGRDPVSGCYFQLRRQYLSLPDKCVLESAALMSGMSMLQSMLMNESESERWYHCLEIYADGGDGSKEAKDMLLYLDIALPHRGSADLPELIRRAAALLKTRRAAWPEFSVTDDLPSQLNGARDLCEWTACDKEMAVSLGRELSCVLGRYGNAFVSLMLAESFLEKGADSYEIITLAEKGKMQAETAGVMEQSFVAAELFAQISLFAGHMQEAAERLAGFEKRAEQSAPQLLPNIRALQCRYDLYRGRTNEILDWLEEAPDEKEEFCILERLRYMVKARVYIWNGQYEQAIGLLYQLLYYAERMKRTCINIEAKLLLAITLQRCGRRGWEKLLQECIARAERYHFVRILSREGAAFLRALRAGEFQWTDKAYKKQVMEESEKMAAFYPSYLNGGMRKDVIRLSSNALKILRLQEKGYSVERIAQILKITPNTVKYHNRETYRKLGVANKSAALNEARNLGLL